MRAIRGTCGIISKIAGNLGCGYLTVRRYLNKPGWEDVRERYMYEIESMCDLAECTLVKAMKSDDLRTASSTARWWLEKKRRQEYGQKSEVDITPKPPNIDVNTNVPIDALDLPLETRRTILAAMRERKRKMLAAAEEAQRPRERRL